MPRRGVACALGLFASFALTLATVASSTAARDPRLPKVALNHADVQRASRALLRLSDLAGMPPGWVPLTTTTDDSTPECPWQNYSSFTITGRGEADFQPTKVGRAGFVGSSIEILATTGDAVGKFEMDTHAGTVACESEALRKAFSPKLKTSSARQLAAPALGERAVAYEFVYEQAKGTPRRIYVDAIEFVRGRAVAVLETTNFGSNASDASRLALARFLDERLK